MRSFILLLAFTIISTTAQSQSVLNTEWVKQVFSTDDGSAESWAVDVDVAGNIYWPVNVDSLGNHDVYCYKFNQGGDELWPAPYHFEAPTDEFSHICDASSDHVYIGGGTCIQSGVNCDMHLIKIDKTTGGQIWQESQDFGNNGYDEVDGLEVRDDGVYISGWAQAIQTGLWQIDMGLWKTDLDGNTEWTNELGEENSGDHLDGHFIVEDDRIVATGLWKGTSAANIFNGKSFIGTFSKTDGSLLDSTLFNFNPDQFLYVENPLGMATDGVNYYVTGYVSPVTINDYQIFVAKFDQDLNLLWNVLYGGSETESARGIVVHDNKIYIAGLTNSPEMAQNGDGDALLLVMDTESNFVSSHVWGGPELDSFRDIVIHDNAVFLTGISGTGFSSEESISGNLIKVNLDDITGINEVSSGFNNISIYPNPSNGSFSLVLQKEPTQNLEFILYNSLGVETHKISLTKKVSEINVDLPSGVYVYKLIGDNYMSTFGRLIIE